MVMSSKRETGETFSIADDWLLITHISSPDDSCFVFQANQSKQLNRIESNHIKFWNHSDYSFESFKINSKEAICNQ